MHRPCYDRTELKEVVDVISGYAFPGYEMGSSGSPIIKIKNIIPPMVDTTDVDRISEEFIASIPKLEKFRLKHKDILIAMTGATVGKIGRFPKANEIFYLNQRVARVDLRNPAQADIDYIYYVLSQTQYTDQIFSLADGSAQANVSASQIGNITMPLPPLPEQRRIAHILGTLDDNIENNRKTAKTLEAMAQAIFQSWFVDFDPVRAKMAGESRESICKRLKLTPEILDLFPDRLVDSELGEIPEGWVVKSLGDLIELAYGKPLKAENRTHGSVPVYGSNGLIGWHDEKLINGPGIVVGRKGNPGTVTWVESNFYPIDTTFYVIPASGIRLRFVYHALMRHDLASLGADSAVPGLNRNLAYISKQLVPHANLCTVFENLTEKLLLPSHNINKQSMVSTEIRDTLLPKLISGEIRVPEAEDLVQEATI
ncbi:restriction endonuclease subunit S [Acidithiobacillus ferriphilus]|uniref:restriction endonuclease subunit S n=1 Tax=Acidithiobacillus ferriphilus TaxID=1689834 RepID=UPI003F51019C